MGAIKRGCRWVLVGGGVAALSAALVGCLGGGEARGRAGSLSARAVVASSGEDAFALEDAEVRSELLKADVEPAVVAVTVAPDPEGGEALSLLIDVLPEVESLSVGALSVGGGEAALFWQGGALSGAGVTRKLWTRGVASPQRLVIPLEGLWPERGPRGVIALTLDADVPGQPTYHHRQLVNAAPFVVSARREGAALYAQVSQQGAGTQPFTLEVIDAQGRTLAQGRASATGALKLSHPMFNADAPLLVIARRGLERAFTTLQP